jgi:GT2 family glycosyltransferase/glycosyltransferase involved in cell wall biosynthesis
VKRGATVEDEVLAILAERWDTPVTVPHLAARLQDPSDRHPWLVAARAFLKQASSRTAALQLLAAGGWRRRMLVFEPDPALPLEQQYWQRRGMQVSLARAPWDAWRPEPGALFDTVLLPPGWVPAPDVLRMLVGALPELGLVLASNIPSLTEACAAAGLTPGEPVGSDLVAHRRLRPVHVVIPVYGAVQYLEQAIHALLTHTGRAPLSVAVIDDATPDPAQADRIAALASRVPGVKFVRHRKNLGFPATANEGIRLRPAGSDVVLLNSDAVVTPHWLPKMAEAAWSRPGVATVTPVSNWAADLSIPCALSLADTCAAFLERRADVARRHYPEVPSGVGFCLYIRDEAVGAVGELDESFGVGYGEEVDFCRRAVAMGFTSVLDDRTFVYHHGHRSMDEHGTTPDTVVGSRAADRELYRRYPDLGLSVERFLTTGHMAALRHEWEGQLRVYRPKQKPRIWLQLWTDPHHEAGGVEATTRDLVEMFSPLYECLVSWTDAARVYLEEPRISLRERSIPRSSWPLGLAPWDGGRLLPTDDLVDEWADILARYRVDLVYAVHPLGAAPVVMAAAERQGLPVVLAVHDYALLCPDYTLMGPSGHHCGAPDDPPGCRTCLQDKEELAAERRPLDWDLGRWRRDSARDVARAGRVVYVSAAARRQVEAVLGATPGLVIEPWRRGDRGGPIPDPDPARILVVLGYRGAQKGADLLVRLVPVLIGDGVRIHFLGSGPREWPELENLGGVTFGGPYRGREVFRRLRAVEASGALLPSAFAETWSLTLSEAWMAGLPAVVSPYGAPAERVRQTGAGVVPTAYTVEAYREAVKTLFAGLGRYRSAARRAAATLPSRLRYGALHAHLLGEVAGSGPR